MYGNVLKTSGVRMGMCGYPVSRRAVIQATILGAISRLPVHAQDNPVLRWNELVLDAIRQTDTPSPVAARALAVVHTAMFEAWAAYDAVAVGTQLDSSMRRPASERTKSNKETAISYAAYRTLVDLFPSCKEAFDKYVRALGHTAFEDMADVGSPVAIGNTAAATLLAYRHRDGSNQLGDLSAGAYSDYTGYQPVNGPNAVNDPNRWQPLRGTGGEPQRSLLPHWGRVKGFALRSGAQFRPGPPPRHGSALFNDRCDEIRRMNAELTDKQKMTVEFWAQGPGTVTTPGYWNQVAARVSRRDGHTLDQDIKLFFLLANAQFDASIAIWDTKREYDSIRPESAIRTADRNRSIRGWAGPGKGTRRIPGEKWQPYLATPPHPDYVSGHSGFSAASAEILKLFTGSDRYDGSATFAPGSSWIEPGVTPKHEVTLQWATFSDAADDAGLSRRLGGIHFEDADIRARIMGRHVAKQVWERVQGLLEANGFHSKEDK